MEPNKKQKPFMDDEKHEKFIDEQTKNKIARHLTDINDEISEEDIKNIITDISSPDAVPGEDEEVTKEELPDGGEKDDEKKDDLPTSWNVLE
ncbi:MAG: hypothetical protein ABIN97_13090 [Ginsengibacter sp.]